MVCFVPDIIMYKQTRLVRLYAVNMWVDVDTRGATTAAGSRESLFVYKIIIM